MITQPVPSIATVTAGWDHFERLSAGTVKLSTRMLLHLTYMLQGAEPNQTYTVGFDVFDVPAPGLDHFGVPRLGGQGQYDREDPTVHRVDIFLVGSFNTNKEGNGVAEFDLDVSGVASGTYDLQLTWSRGGTYPCYYRTGERFGLNFVRITIP